MANKQKHKESSFADMLKELVAAKPTTLTVDAREERKYFLVVTEGIRTEPIYFEFLGSMLPKHLVETVEVKGAGDNTLNVVKKAIQLRDERKRNTGLPAFDEVWAVYDKDDFPDHHYKDAIALALKEGIESGHSNQSFELWYVLHFQFLQSALHRSSYIKTLSEILGVKYEKNMLELAKRIHAEGNVKQAIAWANALETMHAGNNAAKACPFTRVYVLVERLLAYIENRASGY
ncbi:RloB family protein [Pedobacter sp.]|jgi:hypothetical protein|uniref:RloB family protein n=1 Tax=Pedobacter sp. TaxID=1411316 RepID=UPI002C0796D6|nr:RloB family protein [Pedobacter sp.]HWW42240.1 RloB family protein [Pedobacter sp.]